MNECARLLEGASAFSDSTSIVGSAYPDDVPVRHESIAVTFHRFATSDLATLQVTFSPILETLVGAQGIRLPVIGQHSWHWSTGWQKLDSVYVPLGRSAAVLLQDGYVLELLDAVSIRQEGETLKICRIDCTLGAGIRFSNGAGLIGFRERAYRPGALRARLYRSRFPRWQLWPVPGGARAALSVTDHADFDTEHGLAQLAHDQIWRTGVRITKSVFVSNPLGNKPAALSAPDALSEIQRLEAAGNEIAVHSTRPSGAGVPGVLADLHQLPLQVRTWIDHGPISRTNFSRNGFVEGSGDDIRGAMRDAGLRNVWSYLDRASNPASLVGPPRLWSRWQLLHARVTQAREAASTSLRRSAFYLIDGLAGPDLTTLRQRLPDIRRQVSRKSIHAPEAPDPQHRYARWIPPAEEACISLRSPLAAPLHPRAILSDWCPWFFTSVRVNDLSRSLAPDRLSDFIHAGGAEILHTYLLSDHALAGWTGSWATSGARRGLHQLAEAAGSELWVGPIDEWTEHLRAQYELGIELTEQGDWHLESRAAQSIAVGHGDSPPQPRTVAPTEPGKR